MPPRQEPPLSWQQPEDQGYAGPALGRDDPVWTHYLKQSTQRDVDLVKSWNTSMDLLLLFAALFSAVVTAFLIESYKSLQPDAALITAASVSRMVVLVEAIASGQPPAPSNSTVLSPDDFHPAQGDIVINTLWFLSLALSMSVALMAMLVKQWGDAYLIGYRFDARYVQARMRQARYNGLKWWKVKLVVRLLPVMMHVSLGLFLLGLLLFLQGLNLKLFWPVLGAIGVTLAFYFITTLAPLFSPFCPYNTPLSSRTLWSVVYSTVKQVAPHEEKWNISSEQKEKTISTSTARDKLTAQAILWLIGHSQGGGTVDDDAQGGMSIEVSIRAIAETIAGPEFWNYLVKDKLVTLMAQHFTSFFKGTLDPSEEKAVKCDADLFLPPDKSQLALCNQALAKIAKHSDIQLFEDVGPRSTTPERAIAESGRIMLSESYFVLVQRGLLRLIKDESIDVTASAYCAASAWRTSIGRISLPDGEQPLLKGLVNFIRENSDALPQRQLACLMESLAVETSYMIWEFKEEDLKKTLEAVVGLCLSDSEQDSLSKQISHVEQHTDSDLCSRSKENLFSSKKMCLFNGPVRRATSIGLAVIAALLNDYQRISEDEVDRLVEGGRDKFGTHDQYTKAHNAYERRYPYSTDSYLTYSRQWRAVWIAEMCTKNPNYLEANADALLFLGLSGILRSYKMDSNRFGHVVKLFVDLLEMNKEVQPSSMTLPFILTTSRDVRSQVAEDLIAAFHNRPSGSDVETEIAKSHLLKGLSEHGRWIDFGPTLLVGVLKLLKSARHGELQDQCIAALNRYWFAKSPSNLHIYNLPEWRLFVDSGIIHILIERFPSTTSDNPGLRRAVLSCFEKLTRTIILQTNKQNRPDSRASTNQTQYTQTSINQDDIQDKGSVSSVGDDTDSIPQEIFDILIELILKEEALFVKLIAQILCNTEYPDIQFGSWREYIIDLPSKLPTSPDPQATSTGSDLGTSIGSSSLIPVPDPVNVPLPPAAYDEAREWLRAFAEGHVNSAGTLGEMARSLGARLN